MINIDFKYEMIDRTKCKHIYILNIRMPTDKSR